jgi:hypothetical protein
VNCRKPQDHTIHDQIDTQTVEDAGDDCLGDHESKHSTREVIDGRGHERNQEVKDQTEGRRPGSAIKSAPAERPAGDRLQNEDWLSAAPNLAENAGVGNIQRAGDQTAQQNRLICRLFHGESMCEAGKKTTLVFSAKPVGRETAADPGW